MKHLRSPFLGLVLALVFCLNAAPGTALADDAGFSKFCKSWMKKLEARESFNQEKASVEKRNGEFVLEYMGYSRKPTSCSAKRAHGNAMVGTLVYEEIRYQKTGAKRAALGQTSPVVVKRAPVTEIFGHDGKEWLY